MERKGNREGEWGRRPRLSPLSGSPSPRGAWNFPAPFRSTFPGHHPPLPTQPSQAPPQAGPRRQPTGHAGTGRHRSPRSSSRVSRGSHGGGGCPESGCCVLAKAPLPGILQSKRLNSGARPGWALGRGGRGSARAWRQRAGKSPSDVSLRPPPTPPFAPPAGGSAAELHKAKPPPPVLWLAGSARRPQPSGATRKKKN